MGKIRRPEQKAADVKLTKNDNKPLVPERSDGDFLHDKRATGWEIAGNSHVAYPVGASR